METSTAPARVGRPCTICTSADRDAVERDLLTGGTFRGIARRWGLSSDSLRRHVEGHVTAALRNDIIDASGTAGVELATRVLDIAESARDVRVDSESDGRTAIAAGRAELEALTVLADRLGVKTAEVAENVRDSLDLLNAIRFVARDHPEVLFLLADGLDARDRTAWAKQYREAATKFSEMKEVSA